MDRLGFMQGRLTNKEGFYPQQFPIGQWGKEFEIAAQIGFECMEWMFNFEQWEENPIINKRGIEKICELIESTGIEVSGICANYFMNRNLFDHSSVEENIDILLRLVEGAELLGCSNLTIPLFEASEMQFDSEIVKNILEHISTTKINILFESNCEMEILYKWLKKNAYKNVGVCYDIGNATGLGRNTVAEVSHYADIVKNVHIKDKTMQGHTVMLGQGDAKIRETIEMLKEKEYKGCYILESYYGVDAINDTKKNYYYVKDFFEV